MSIACNGPSGVSAKIMIINQLKHSLTLSAKKLKLFLLKKKEDWILSS